MVMQTFLPYNDFAASAAILDRQRLGKQRVEAFQILKALEGGGGWSNHPAVKMWRGYEQALRFYGRTVCDEWIARGYRDALRERFIGDDDVVLWPWWMGDPDFHRSHQSNLLRKDSDHYRQFFPDGRDDLPYLWPNNDTHTFTEGRTP